MIEYIKIHLRRRYGISHGVNVFIGKCVSLAKTTQEKVGFLLCICWNFRAYFYDGVC